MTGIPFDPPGAMGPLQRGRVRLEHCVPGQADAARQAAWLALLSPDEQARAARFHFAEDRRAYLAAHALARRMLAGASGRAPSSLRFVAGPAGRPELDPALGLPGLRFNLSHARGLVACALALEDDVGVDVEALSRAARVADLAARYFAPEEAAALARLPAERREAAFLRLWTLKEAFVKAIGQGLSFGLERFALRLDPPALLRAPAEAGPVSGWAFHQAMPLPDHVLSVALRRRG
ncbi:4'-phosphopantetheinyl transferase superfamily protein [Pseudoroseomonas cervicalis]|uniref:4'-phosphopantetheinyl transferase family protein n=1 Tax=Teichococcus cervicalis TaxID=204525 RepID=UPI00277D6C8D|nr:4'-phosphopantetheinyl transferase superfamily protein [Pseudoroseomonas cervicalis]MDQ1081823.1 4'-phosphopantetheinyl transferase [Pseudoroseomonas cervicalis]